MKNGRAMKGHRRIEVAIEPTSIRRRAPAGGWNVSCICGWDGGNWRNSTLAHKAYKEHIDYQIDQCAMTCKRCGEEKPLSQMRPDYRYICLKCFSTMGNEWQQKHPVEAARHKRNHQLLRTYGITLAEYEQMIRDQRGMCAICKTDLLDLPNDTPHVDHDHVHGHVRGILCFSCNSGLGSFKDNVERLRAAIQYLEQS